MAKILWVSRHKPLTVEVAELKRLYGTKIDVVHYNGRIHNAVHFKQIIEMSKAIDVVVILPYSIIKKLNELGVKPLFAKMDTIDRCGGKCSDFKADSDYIDPRSGSHSRFVKFLRIENIEIKYSEVMPLVEKELVNK